MTSAWGATLFAVHISDGVLAWPWVVGGFVVAGLLALLAAFRIRDEEIPRIALMTAAFFVASLIHVKLGPTSVHLLLNGLLGVVLGRRAPLAVLVGVGLQALLLGHGGVSTIGVNACVMGIPALLAGWLFAALARERWMRHPWYRFALGCFVGALAVLLTTAFNAAVLIWGAAEDVRAVAVLVFLAHLPIVVIEGVVLGFAVGFLARVKPEMLGGLSWRPDFWRAAHREPPPVNGATPADTPAASDAVQPAAPEGVRRRPPALLLALFGLFGAAGTAEAHRIDAQCFLLPDKRRVQVESWFSDGSKPQAARVQVFRPDGSALAEGTTNDQGVFVFGLDEAEDLKVVVDAGAGHRKEVVVPKEKLGSPPPRERIPPEQAGAPPAPPTPLVDHAPELPYAGVLAGLGFLLGLAAFVISLRNMRRLQELKRRLDNSADRSAGANEFISHPGIRLPAAPPTDPGRR
jgi:cobalt/nickel transport system permease protein